MRGLFLSLIILFAGNQPLPAQEEGKERFASLRRLLRPVSGTPPKVPAKEPVSDSEPAQAILTVSAKQSPQANPSPRPRAWAERYELGPGDVLNLGLKGQPNLRKDGVIVSPDGRISYLHAKQVSVLGRTVDEVRSELTSRLSAHYRDPIVIVAPAKLGSKQFTILGEVRNNGTFSLTRPTTLLEALAAAGGFQLGSLGEDAVELADLKRSFLIRRGDRLPVDFEGLYLRGDFSQNVLLEPNDYIYIASMVRNEIYVLGKVTNPGAHPIRPDMTATAAVAAAGGFSQTAWRNRVLVVRGRMYEPQTHVVALNQVLHGRNEDIALEPGDLVFVSTRPWAYAAQVIDAALLAYIDGTVAGLLAEDDIGFSVGPGF